MNIVGLIKNLWENYRKLKKKYFRPKMPSDWEKNSREWLSTLDIENVLNQYEKKYKNFLFIGAVQ